MLLVTSNNLHETSRNLQKNMCLIACTPLHQNHIYPDLPPLEQFLRAIWNAVSQAIILILPQIKLNSHIVLFFFFLGWQGQPQIGTHHGCLPSISTRIKSCAAAAADFQYPLKGAQGEEQKEALWALGKLAEQVLQIARYFQELIYEPNSYISSYLEKH